ncbi:PRC-barrel domain containing protein [Pararhodobacter sp.]|uniref:PRC-barrel domain containing protein n=1 Tax=Pararhodobacter sp. TaxID=2127056 RepID=UPI002FDEF7DA
MDHSAHPRLTDAELTQDILAGATVYGPGDQKIGHIDHLHGAGPSAQVIIDVGGFLGIGAKPVRIPLSELDAMRDESGTVHAVTSWSKEALKDLPEHRD